MPPWQYLLSDTERWALVDYIKIPNKSPDFDHDWEKHGFMDQAVDLLSGWAKQKIAAMPEPY